MMKELKITLQFTCQSWLFENSNQEPLLPADDNDFVLFSLKARNPLMVIDIAVTVYNHKCFCIANEGLLNSTDKRSYYLAFKNKEAISLRNWNAFDTSVRLEN